MHSYQTLAAADWRRVIYETCRCGYQLSALFANDEREMATQGFVIYCLLQKPQQWQAYRLVVPAGQDEFPSVTSEVPAAAWYEREIHDLFGLVPSGHPDLRPLVLHENWPQGFFPLRKDAVLVPDETAAKREYPMRSVQGEGVFEVPVGPIHAGIIEPGHFRFSQVGERVLQLDAKLFFTHRGIEKTLEGKPFREAEISIERICGACSASHALAYAQAVEQMAGMTVPPRAVYIRVLVAELERLYNHIGDIGNLCAGVGFAPGISQGARLKEVLQRLNEMVTGNRFLRGMIQIGGVAFDVPPLMLAEISRQLELWQVEADELVQLLQERDAFLDRINRTGVLAHQAAVDLAVVGVGARAAGVACDMRRDHPYAAYAALDFTLAVHKSGDVAARLWVRADEMAASLSIIRQVLALLEGASSALSVELPLIPAGVSGWGWCESPRGGMLHWLMAGAENTLYRAFIRSASYPNWPALTLAAPGNIIPDFPLINKSFELCYACLDR